MVAGRCLISDIVDVCYACVHKANQEVERLSMKFRR